MVRGLDSAGLRSSCGASSLKHICAIRASSIADGLSVRLLSFRVVAECVNCYRAPKSKDRKYGGEQDHVDANDFMPLEI